MLTNLTDCVYAYNWGGWLLETPNCVPGVQDKVPLMIGGAKSLLNPGWNTVCTSRGSYPEYCILSTKKII